jgi:hypothetical protein
MKYERKTKPALWALAFPGQVRANPEKKRRHHGMSAKRRKESDEYRKLRIEFLRLNPTCMRCGKPAQCIHHWAGRRSNYLRVETFRASCIACNDFAKNDPKAAREEGWIAPVGVYLT